ncbi:MAG: transcription antitermination factor NusB [Acholeplasmataceae bacterium]
MMNKDDQRTTRIHLMEALYQYDIYQEQSLDFTPNLTDEDHLKVYHQMVERISEIDQIIEKHLYNYRLNRLSFVDRAIIRLAVFELLEKVVPGPIVIDEAIELTKIYTNLDDEKQHKFNNKLLDAIYQSLKD